MSMRAADAAKELGVSRNTLLRWFREGRVAEVSRDRRGWRVFASKDLERIRAELGDFKPGSELDPKRQKIRDYLRRVPIFTTLPDSVLAELASCARFFGHKRGTHLFSPDDHSRGLYILVKGKVRVFRASAQGREQTLALVTPFQTLAESVTFRADQRHTSFAVCVESSTVVILPTTRVHQLIQTTPRLASVFLREFASRISDLEQRLEEQALLNLEQRVGRALLNLPSEQSLTAKELASLLGVARESVSRVLNRMERDGLFRREGNLFTAIDREFLQDM